MTGPALALVPAPDDDASGEFGHVLSGVMLAGDAMLLAAALDRDFLAGAGWNPEIRVLSMPAAHPLLGRRLCRTGGCTATAHGSGTGGLCYQCSSRLARAGWTPEEIRSAGELPPLPARADGCLVPGCQRMSPGGRQGQRAGLCQTHSRRFRRVPGTTIEAFLADPRVRPLPPLGPCRVAACSRRSESEHGYCPTHYVRRRAAAAAAPGSDQVQWDLACPAVAEPGRVSLRGLPPLVVVQVLAGIQYRAREQGAKITDVSLRAVCDELRRQRAVSAVTADPEQITGKAARSLLRAFARRARLALAGPAREQLADTWDLAVFGHPGGLSFTAITQPWLREAAKAWAAEELPRHRGGGAAKVREKISATARLSESLRCRDDRGEDPQVLGRTDAEAFLNRLGYLESAGRISRYQRNVLCRGARFVLTGIRALGLTRPGQPAAGLPGDFTVGAGDIPADPVRGEPGRDLPAGVMNQLCAGLDSLEPAEVRTAIAIAIDTGRRPEDILGLPLDCLDRDPDGAPVLVYDNITADRPGRRLPVGEATADVIRAQQARVRARYPAEPVGTLRLLPAPRANPHGRKAITIAMLGDRCCPALKIPILAAFTMPMKNRAFRAVSWARCLATWARCRTDGAFWAVVAVCGQAGAGNGAGGLAGRDHGQQPAAGQHVDPRPPAGVLQPVTAAQDQRCGRQVLQCAAQLVSAGPGQQLIMAGCQDGADARDAQLGGGPAGGADPAAHGPGRDGQAGGDVPVPVPAGGGDQGLPDQPGGVGAARQQARIEHHVGGTAAGAQRTVRADCQQRPAGVADRALTGAPPRPQRLIAARAAQHPARQGDPGRCRVEDLDHRPSRQDRPGRLVRTRGQLVLQRATPRRPAQPGPARSPGTGTWPTPGPAACAPDRRSLTPRIAHRHGAAANEPAWPVIAIGVPGAATASRHGNPERLSTTGTGTGR